MAKKSGLDSGFLILYDWLPALESLSGDDVKTLLLALIARQKNGTPLPDFDGLVGVFAAMIEPTILRRLEGQVHASKTTLKGTSEGTLGASRAKQSIEEQSIAPPTPSRKKGEECEGEGTDRMFSRFWESYPKHSARKEAKAAFDSLSLSEAEVDELLKLVEVWKKSEQWIREGGRYVKRPDKFLLEIFPERSRPPESSKSTQSAGSFETDAAWKAALRRSYNDLLDGGG